MRLIDADAFIKMMEEKCDHDAALDELVLRVCRGGINMMPLIDSITECSKCKHCDKDSPNNYMYCKVWKRETAGNWYCSRGIPDDETN